MFFVNPTDILSWKMSQGTEGNRRKTELYWLVFRLRIVPKTFWIQL